MRKNLHTCSYQLKAGAHNMYPRKIHLPDNNKKMFFFSKL